MFTIDASVWLNAVSPTETAYEQSRAFIELVLGEGAAIIVPTLLTVEVVATIGRRKNRERVGDLAGLFQLMKTVQWISLDEGFSQRAAAVALQSQLRTGDSVYATVAIENKCVLVSLDKDHLKRLTGIVKVVTPEQALTLLQENGS